MNYSSVGTWMLLFSLSLLSMGGCRTAQNASQVNVEDDAPTHSYISYEEPVYNDNINDNYQVVPVALAQDILKKKIWKLTLQEAVIIALENNKDIAVVRFLPDEKLGEIPIEYSDFDPNLNLGTQWQRTDQQVANASSGSGTGIPAVQTDLFGPAPGLTDQLGITKKMETGTKTSLYYGSNYTMTNPTGNFLLVNPSWDSRLNFQLEQPIFKGRGRYVNRLGVEIANANYHVSRHEFQKTVSQTIRDVELAYWEIIASEANMVSRQVGVDESSKTLDVEEGKHKNGLNAISEVAQAREQFESLNAELSLALQMLSNSERFLRRLMGIRAEDGRRIVPVTDPLDFNNLPVWESGVLAAMQQRPELESQRSSIYSAKLSLDREANNLQHDLNAFAGYTVNGLSDGYDQSTKVLSNNNFTDWSLGFRYERTLGQRAEKARVFQAERKLLREKAQLRNLKHEIKMELHEAFQAIFSSKEILQFQTKRKNAALLQLEAHEELYKKGQANLDLFLRSQLTHLNAMRDESKAISKYNQALARWSFATGNNLYSSSFPIEQPARGVQFEDVFNGPQLMPVEEDQQNPSSNEIEEISPLEIDQIIIDDEK